MPVKEKVGVVISNAMQKTLVIKVESRYSHPIYAKIMVNKKIFGSWWKRRSKYWR